MVLSEATVYIFLSVVHIFLLFMEGTNHSFGCLFMGFTAVDVGRVCLSVCVHVNRYEYCFA